MIAGRRRELEQWAAALARSEIGELRAAGRAIVTLCKENEALERRLERLESAPPDEDAAGGGTEAGSLPRAHRKQDRRSRRRLPWRRMALAAGALVGLAAALGFAAEAAAPELSVAGLEQGALVGIAALPKLQVVAKATDAEWRLDGEPIVPRMQGERAVWRPRRLSEGAHELVVRRTGGLFVSSRRTIDFTVDTKPPVLVVEGPALVSTGRASVLAGTVVGGTKLQNGKREIALGSRGRFRLVIPRSRRQLLLTATDAAGNTSRWRVPVTVVPRRPAQPVRAVHVTAYAWADADLRRGIMELVRTRRVNAVQLDLKDESGEVGWSSGVLFARRIGSQLDIYDLPKALKQLHRSGIRVIGRIVCFRDPIHARAAWKSRTRTPAKRSRRSSSPGPTETAPASTRSR